MKYKTHKTSSTYGTSDSDYKIKLVVEYQVNDNDSIPASSSYRLQIYIMRTGEYKRMQHSWRIKYNIDGTVKYDKQLILPDDNAKPGVVSAGYLIMQKDTWYKWGSPYTITLKNDGTQHSFKAQALCLVTTPRTCPSSGWCSISAYNPVAPAYLVKTPTSLSASYNAKANSITYKWADASKGVTVRFNLYREMINAKGTVTKVNTNLTATTLTVTDTDIPADVTTIKYKVTAYGSHSDSAVTSLKTLTKPILNLNSKVDVKIDNVWHKASAYVKVDGAWRKCSKIYVKDGNTWKQVKS